MRALLLVFAALSAFAQPMQLDLAAKTGPLEIDHMALGQGGLSEQPMWDDRVNEVRMLHPRIIRLFIQEYFDLLPKPGKYHWDTLDSNVDLIRKTGATPLMNIVTKPRSITCACMARYTVHAGTIAIDIPSTTPTASQATLALTKAFTNQSIVSPPRW